MDKVCLVFDSSANIKNGQFKHVYVVPLLITETKDGKITTYRDGVDIDGPTCVKKLKDGACLKTAQSNPKDVIELLDKLTKQYKNVFFFTCPLQLSNQLNSIRLIASEYKNVTVFKQNTIANFSIWTVEDLQSKILDGTLTAKNVQDYLDKTQYTKVGVLNVPDFKYLKRGGRVSGVKAAFGSLFKVKISISYSEAGLVLWDSTVSVEKLPQINEASFKHEVPGFAMNKIKRIWFGTSENTDKKFGIAKIMGIMKKHFALGKLAKNVKVYSGPVSPVITAHTGPNYVIVAVDCTQKLK